MSNNMKASRNWASRPADDRFFTLPEAIRAASQHRQHAREVVKAWGDLSVVPGYHASGIPLDLATGRGQAQLSHWALSQLGRYVGVGTGTLGLLRPDTATVVLNELMEPVARDRDEQKRGGASILLSRQADGLQAQAFTSQQYGRLWDDDFLSGIADTFGQAGWRVPPAMAEWGWKDQGANTRIATEEDRFDHPGVATKISPGDLIAPSGLYASDHDSFVLMIDYDAPIDPGTGSPLFRGIMAENSEVGASRARITRFLFDTICGNHIIWGCRVEQDVSLVHRGDSRDIYKRFNRMLATVTSDLGFGDSAHGEEETIRKAREVKIGRDREETIDKAYAMKVAGKKTLGQAYDLESHAGHYGDPNSVWGFLSRVTEHNRDEIPHADKRREADKQAARLLELVAV